MLPCLEAAPVVVSARCNYLRLRIVLKKGLNVLYICFCEFVNEKLVSKMYFCEFLNEKFVSKAAFNSIPFQECQFILKKRRAHQREYLKHRHLVHVLNHYAIKVKMGEKQKDKACLTNLGRVVFQGINKEESFLADRKFTYFWAELAGFKFGKEPVSLKAADARVSEALPRVSEFYGGAFKPFEDALKGGRMPISPLLNLVMTQAGESGKRRVNLITALDTKFLWVKIFNAPDFKELIK